MLGDFYGQLYIKRLGGRNSMAIPIKNTPAFTSLFPQGDTVTRLASGFAFTEGPIWHPRGRYLLFSDMPGDVRRRWDIADGVTEVRRPSNKCNGMTYDSDLNLLVCEHATSMVVMESPSGTRKVLASHFEGKELNSPNDIVSAADGTIYFSDPAYGRLPGFGVERDQELDFQGLYRIDTACELHLEVKDFVAPNGLCFSPDGSVLYVNDTALAHIRAFDISPDGSLTNESMFFENIGDGDLAKGVPDGMKIDEQGNIYVTGPGGIWVIDAEANYVGLIEVPENVGNMNWGGDEWRTLLICASTSLYSITVAVPGARSSYMPARKA
jgi:gluconolactonase